MKIDYLSNHSHFVKEIAELKFQQYHHFMPEKTLLDYQKALEIELNDDEEKLPIAFVMILETAIQDDKVMQDFESESLPIGGGHSQIGKTPPVGSDYGLKTTVNLSSSIAVSRMIDQGSFVGMVSLRKQDLPSHPHLTPWLGGLFVHPSYRKKGLGTFLAVFAEQSAQRLGYPQLYLWTSEKQAWYANIGWQTIDQTLLHNHPITVMKRDLRVP